MQVTRKKKKRLGVWPYKYKAPIPYAKIGANTHTQTHTKLNCREKTLATDVPTHKAEIKDET